MKNALLLISAISLISFSAMAAGPKLLKSCTTIVQMPGEPQKIPTKIDIVALPNNTLSAITTQKVKGKLVSQSEVSSIGKFKIRPGVNPEQDGPAYNFAEQLIAHAMMMTSDPDFGGIFSAGLDLRKVRYATVFTSGDAEMGASAIVEARDVNGNILGSFLGGFLVHPCK